MTPETHPDQAGDSSLHPRSEHHAPAHDIGSTASHGASLSAARHPSLLSRFRHPFYGVLQLVAAFLAFFQPMNFVSGDPPPDEYSLSLYADDAELEPGETTSLYAVLWNVTADLPVEGATVLFTVESGNGYLQDTQAITDANGCGVVLFTGGVFPSQIRLDDLSGLGAQTSGLIEVAGPPHSYAIQVWSESEMCTPGGSTDIYARLTDTTTQSPVPLAMINFSIPSGNGVLSAVSAITDENGECFVRFTGGDAPSQINAWDGHGLGVSGSTSVQVNEYVPQYAIILFAEDNTLLPGESTTLYAKVVDEYYNNSAPVSGIVLNFDLQFGDGFVSSLSGETNDQGICAIAFTGGEHRTQVDVWDVNGRNLSNSYTFQVEDEVPGSPVLQLWCDNNPLEPGSATSLYARLSNETGALVAGATITFYVTSGDGGLGQSSAVTDGSGIATVTFSGGFASSEITVQDESGYGAANSITIAASPEIETPPPYEEQYSLYLYAQDSTLSPGSETTLFIFLHVYDELEGLWLPVSGQTVELSITAGDGALNSGASAISIQTDENGTGEAYFTAGTLTTEIAAIYGVRAQDSFAIGIISPPGNILLWADRNNLVGGETMPLNAQVTDASGLPAVGMPVSFTLEHGDGTLSSTSATTDEYGYCSIIFTGGETASRVYVEDVSGATQTYDFGVIPHDYRLTLWSDSGSLEAGTSTTVCALLEDLALSAPISGATVNFGIIGGPGSLDSATGITNENGICTVTFTGGAEASGIAASDAHNMGTSATCSIGVSVPSYHLSLSTPESSLVPGDSSTITALVIDVGTGAPVSGMSLSFAVMSVTEQEGYLNGSTGITGQDGRCAVGFVGGNAPSEVYVWDVLGIGVSASCWFGVTDNHTYEIQLTADANPLRYGEGTQLQVQFMDTTANSPVANAELAFLVTSGDGTLGLPSGVTGQDGTCTVPFTGGNNPTIVRVVDLSGRGVFADYTFTRHTDLDEACECGRDGCPGMGCSGLTDPAGCHCGIIASCQCIRSGCPGTTCSGLSNPEGCQCGSTNTGGGGIGTGIGSDDTGGLSGVFIGDGAPNENAPPPYDSGSSEISIALQARSSSGNLTRRIGAESYTEWFWIESDTGSGFWERSSIASVTTLFYGQSNGTVTFIPSGLTRTISSLVEAVNVLGSLNGNPSAGLSPQPWTTAALTETHIVSSHLNGSLPGAMKPQEYPPDTPPPSGTSSTRLTYGDEYTQQWSGEAKEIRLAWSSMAPSQDLRMPRTFQYEWKRTAGGEPIETGTGTLTLQPFESHSSSLIMLADASADGNVTVSLKLTEVPTIEIKRDEAGGDVEYKLIHDDLAKALPGHKINLKAEISNGSTPTNIRWTLPGKTFADYSEFYGRGVTLTPVSPENLTSQELQFYWSDYGQKTIQVTMDLNGEQRTASATIDVTKPTVSMFTSTIGKSCLIGRDFGLHKNTYEPGDGIAFTGQVNIPSSYPAGSWCFVQVTNPNRWRVDAYQRIFQWSLNGQWCFDVITNPFSTGSQGTLKDGPGEEIGPFTHRFCRTSREEFYTYIFFKPFAMDGTARWVPLQRAHWYWSLDIYYNGGETWETYSSEEHVADPEDIADHPTWSEYVQDGQEVHTGHSY